MTLKKINSLLHIDTGAPMPIVIANEQKLSLLYYFDKESEINTEFSVLPKERNIEKDSGIAVITFNNIVIHKFGYPNDEVLLSHPYYSIGLESYGMFEVEKSDWIDSIEKMNRIHPFHSQGKYNACKHYIITFKDSTFECIAEEVKLNFVTKTLEKVVESIIGSYVLCRKIL